MTPALDSLFGSRSAAQTLLFLQNYGEGHAFGRRGRQHLFAAWWHWSDRQSWDQAVMVARFSTIDYDELRRYARDEGADPADIDKLRQQAEKR